MSFYKSSWIPFLQLWTDLASWYSFFKFCLVKFKPHRSSCLQVLDKMLSSYPVLTNQIQSSNHQNLAILNCSILSLEDLTYSPSFLPVDAGRKLCNLPLPDLAKPRMKSSYFHLCNYGSLHNTDVQILHSSTSYTKCCCHILKNMK